MKKKTLLIKTADLCIRIHYKYPYIEQQCETWRVNEGYEPDIEVSVTDEEIETEYAGYRAESVSRALCESTCIYRAIARKLIAFQAFVMHGAVLELDGKAYVFTAKSGVGKTTHIRSCGSSILKAEQVILTGISRSSDVKTAYGMHMAHRGWEKKSLEVKVLRRFRQFALLNGEKKIRFKRLLIRKL